MKGESDKSENAFRKKVEAIFSNVADLGLNTVIVQVRAFSDALYKSDYFPWSYYLTGVQGQAPGYDPLKIMVEVAHSKKLSIEAWFNPYRVASSSNVALSADNPAKKWLDSGSDNVFVNSSGIYYNP
ncbi:MAG: family 10 glycosylhydrolase, partial [Clostridiales bacterium]|nr:family 10 glycosylhydrolase [Clostridiales bacterium]